MSSSFVISLDFELLWGVRDIFDKNTYGQNVLGARVAIPRMLDFFEAYGIRATWATVGFLFCESRDELMDVSPPQDQRPRYTNPALSSYCYLPELGRDETDDPYYFAPSLINDIAKAPGQEIATHTFSHFYTLEPGATSEAFAADLKAAVAIAQRRGITLKSIVFPRNQYGPEHIEACQKAGITAWRGNAQGWAYKPTAGEGQTLSRRGLRLLDAYSGILGAQTFSPVNKNLRNVPASRFLRPRIGQLAALHFAHISTIKRGMTRAARTGRSFHLWWHPHNFGQDMDGNLSGLKEILCHFRTLRTDYGMRSLAMCEAT